MPAPSKRSRRRRRQRRCGHREPLERLEQIVVPRFAAVVDKRRAAPSWAHPPYPHEVLRRWYKVGPVRDATAVECGVDLLVRFISRKNL